MQVSFHIFVIEINYTNNMASNLPPGFEDPADDDDIHEMAEMPFVEEIINDESFMDCLKRVNKSNISSPYDTHDLNLPRIVVL